MEVLETRSNTSAVPWITLVLHLYSSLVYLLQYTLKAKKVSTVFTKSRNLCFKSRSYKLSCLSWQIYSSPVKTQALTLSQKLTLSTIPPFAKCTEINRLANSFTCFLCWILNFKSWLPLLKSTRITWESPATLSYCHHSRFLLWPSAISLSVIHYKFLRSTPY